MEYDDEYLSNALKLLLESRKEFMPSKSIFNHKSQDFAKRDELLKVLIEHPCFTLKNRHKC